MVSLLAAFLNAQQSIANAPGLEHLAEAIDLAVACVLQADAVRPLTGGKGESPCGVVR